MCRRKSHGNGARRRSNDYAGNALPGGGEEHLHGPSPKVRAPQFALKFRVPGWSKDMSSESERRTRQRGLQAGNVGRGARAWKPGDKVEVTIPLRFRYSAVDQEHPHASPSCAARWSWCRKATPTSRLQAARHRGGIEQVARARRGGDAGAAAAAGQAGLYTMHPADGATVRANFLPLYAAIESLAYRMYFDNDKLPDVLW